MGLILLYILIGVVAGFAAYYYDYKSVAGKWWCDNPGEFAAQFAVFHVLTGIFWPIATLVLLLIGVGRVIAWVFNNTFGKGFAALADWLSKKGL